MLTSDLTAYLLSISATARPNGCTSRASSRLRGDVAPFLGAIPDLFRRIQAGRPEAIEHVAINVAGSKQIEKRVMQSSLLST
jgi:hypothetical protein